MARINVLSVVKDFTASYVKSNPNSSVQDVQVALREHLQLQKKNGVKISPNEIIQAQHSVPSVYYDIKNYVPTPTTKKVANNLNKEKAVKAYRDYTAADAAKYNDGLSHQSKQARQNAHKRNLNDAKAAFVSNEFLEKVKTENPQAYAEMTAISPSNNEIKRQNNNYKSVKKQKIEAAKAREVAKAERSLNGVKYSKQARNAAYLTSTGQMSHEGRLAYNKVKNSGNTPKVSASMIENMQSKALSGKSAKASAEVFMKNGFAPVIENTAKAAKKSKTLWGLVVAGVTTAVSVALFGSNKAKPEVQNYNQVA